MKNLALLLSSADDSYGQALIRGAHEALDPGTRLICCVTGALHSSHGIEAQRNFVYNLLEKSNFDGIILAGALSHHASREEIQALCQRMAPLPVISLAVSLGNLPSVLTDNRPGLMELMNHLLDVHGYERFAFVQGPQGQEEAEIRKACFLESLAQRGLDPQALLEGDFTRESAHHFVGLYLDSGAPLPQAFVCANDSMAMGTMEVLQERSIRVPEDCAVTGFDDMEESAFSRPGLTTVRQSPFRQARNAVCWIQDQWKGETQRAPLQEESLMVLRSSCACPAQAQAPDESGEFEDPQFRFRKEQRYQLLRRSSEAFLSSFHRDHILHILNQDLPEMGFSDCFLSLFVPGKSSLKNCRLFFAKDRRGPWPEVESRRSFDSMQIIPGGLHRLDPRTRIFLLEALYSQDTKLGFLVLGTDLEGTYLSGTIRTQLSSALQALLLLDAKNQKEKKLQQSQRELLKRQKALEKAHGELQQTLGQLVETEKMAALGNLVAGVAHEINTPLGVALTGNSFVLDQVGEIQQSIRTGALRKSELENFLISSFQTLGLIQSNLQRAASLVHSFKHIAADQSQEKRQEFILGEYLEEILVSLSPELKSHRVKIKLQGAPKIRMQSFPGALVQVLANLIMNSIHHGFSHTAPSETLDADPEQGAENRINLEYSQQGNLAVLVYQDNGRGIPPDVLPRIFDPFYTTRRGKGGTGLGLHIVFNLVHHVLGGDIVCTSLPGVSTTFKITLPLSTPENSGQVPR